MLRPIGVGFAGCHSPASGKGVASRLPGSLDRERRLTRGRPGTLRAEFSLFDSDLAGTTVVIMVALLVLWRYEKIQRRHDGNGTRPELDKPRFYKWRVQYD
jgi:hypothetical protein